jgi:hypothetical protein
LIINALSGERPTPRILRLQGECGRAGDPQKAELDQFLERACGWGFAQADFTSITHGVDDLAVIGAVVPLPDVDQHLYGVGRQRLPGGAREQPMG